MDAEESVDSFESTKAREFVLWGYPVFATPQEWRDLNLRIVSTELWRDWNAADYLVKHGAFVATMKDGGGEGAALCRNLADLDRRMHRLVDAEILKLEARRR